MPKTLEEAIGCWTVNPEYNSLPHMAKNVLATARQCRSQTLRNHPRALMRQLVLLRKRLESMAEVTEDAIRRLQQILDTNELTEG